MAKRDDGVVTTLTMVGEGGEAAVVVDQVDHEAVRQRVREAKARIEEDGWALSEALYEVYQGALYQAWGFAGWNDYVEQELEFKIRKAQYFVNVQAWVRRFAPDFMAWVRALGLSKARLLATRVTPENADQWRPRLEGKTYREIEAILAGEDPEDDGDEGDAGDGDEGEGGSGGSKEQTEQVRFNLFPAQKQNVDLAVQRAKELAQTDSEAHALDLIATSFLAGEGNLADVGEYLGSVERSLGLRMIVWQRKPGKKDKLVYGADLMDEFMNELSDEDQEVIRERAEADEDDPNDGGDA